MGIEKPKNSQEIPQEEHIGPIEKTKIEIPDYLKPYLTPEQLAGKHAILIEQVEEARKALKEKESKKA